MAKTKNTTKKAAPPITTDKTTYSTGNPLAKLIDLQKDFDKYKGLKPADAKKELLKSVQSLKNDIIKGLSNLEKSYDDINASFEAIKKKVTQVKNLSFNDNTLLNRLNEIVYLLEELTPLIADFTKAADLLFENIEKNKKTILFDDATLDLIDELKNGRYQLNAKKNLFEKVVREIKRKLASINTGRTTLDGTNPIDWDEDPTLYENTTIGLGHVLIIKQMWKNDGYSLGDVEGSIVLQPMQVKQVASIDWTRTDTASRTEESTQTESLTNTVTRESDSQEIIKTALAESLSGQSNVVSKSRGGSIGGSIAGSIGSAIFGISGGYQSSRQQTSSTASQNSSRDLASNAMQSLKDRIQQSASSVRSQRNTVIQTVSQSESANATTEIIANYNRRHSLTTMWFSINRHFVIEQELVDVQECLFLPMPMSEFDIAKIYRWRDILKANLLDPSHAEAFNAVERIVDEYENIFIPDHRYCDEPIDYIEGELSISFEIPRIPDPDETMLEAAIAEKNSERIGAALENTNMMLDLVYGPFFFLLKNTFASKRDAYLNRLKNEEKARRDYVYEKEIVPVMVNSIVDQYLQLYVGDSQTPLKADFTLVDKYENLVSINRSQNLNTRVAYVSPKGRPLRIKFRIYDGLGFTREQIKQIRVRINGTDQSETLPEGVRIILHSSRIKYATAFGEYMLYSNGNIKDDLNCSMRGNNVVYDEAVLVTTRKSFIELQNPRKEDRIKAARLISHLNQNIEKYHTIIWMGMDTNRLFRLMDGYIAPNSGGRSVASVVDTQPLGIVGNNIILKVVPGANLDPFYRLNTETGASLLDHYKPEKHIDIFRITVKNPGLYGESILGKCESAETIDDSKLWRYEDLKIPYLPSEIQPVSLDTRFQNPGDLQVKDMATPMINMQTLTPDSLKESALKDAINLIGKGDSFRDTTGLAGNQDLVKNAQNQNTEILKNTTDAANSAMQMGVNYSLQKQKQDLEAYKELSKQATPEEMKELRKKFMDGWESNNSAMSKALDNSQEIAKKQAEDGTVDKSGATLEKMKDFVGAGSAIDKLKINPDGSLEAEGLTTSGDNIKKWVTNNSDELLKIARDYDLKQDGKEDRSNVCWAYALAMTLYPTRNWDSAKGNEALIEEMLGLIETDTTGETGPLPDMEEDSDDE